MLALSAAVLATAPRRAAAQALETMRIVGVPTDDMTPVYYAIQKGLYQKAGLDVQVVPTPSGSVATTAVVSGASELGKGSPIASMVAHLRGLPIVAIGNGTIWDVHRPYNVITVATDSPVKTGADLNGKIAASPGLNDINSLAISAWVDKNGGDASTLKWIEVPVSEAAAALIEHRIDVCALLEPQLTDALETGKVRVLSPGFNAIADRFVIGLYFTNPDYAAKHPDAVRTWMRVTYDAGAYTNAHRPETAPMMSQITKIPLPLFQKMARAEAGTMSSGSPTLLQPLVEAAAKYKQIPRAFPAKEMYFS